MGPDLSDTQATRLQTAIARAENALLELQQADGYWVFELEADCTIPAEYLLMMHYMNEIDTDLQAKIAVYLRARQLADGGWPLYQGGGFDISCSVKAYYALKLAGDDPDQTHMVTAREAILAHGGAARANVFTRITLALFGQIPWRGVPFMPVELLLLPRWFPFHRSKIAYWSRTVMVPLLILCTLKPRARNPKGIQIRELFTVPPEEERHYFPVRSRLNRVFLALEKGGRLLESLIPRRLRRRALHQAQDWFIERLNGDGGLGAIFPAMVNAYEALDCLGYPADHPYRLTAQRALQRLLAIKEQSAYCQPCVSPVWDTLLACCALQESEGDRAQAAVRRGFDWLKERQLLDEPGDWQESRPNLKGGGWAFQFENSYYPDLDDTAFAAWAMMRMEDGRYQEAVRRAAEWLCGMQSRNGGFAAFDVDNTYYYLNEIPFADHGALLDPPTADVSARCAMLFARLAQEDSRYRQALDRCLAYLRREQEPDGSWFGRWGTNYIYGTWSVLLALSEIGIPPTDPMVRRAVEWLQRMQRPDGGWGEDNDTYAKPEKAGQGAVSTAFQTAWALLGLMAVGQVDAPAVRRGIEYLLRNRQPDGLWQDEGFTAPGFPRVFYLKYHGYDKFFPLWALARYRNLLSAS
jgi:squalene-hopene/tetraprenyl-beta-curcumene cyclase